MLIHLLIFIIFDTSMVSKHPKWKVNHFLSRLRHFENAHSLQSHLETHLDRYKAQYGVLLFLYSVILTKVRFIQEKTWEF